MPPENTDDMITEDRKQIYEEFYISMAEPEFKKSFSQTKFSLSGAQYIM